MLEGLYFILTAWLIPGLPLWFSIVNTILGALFTCTSVVKVVVYKSTR